MLFPNYTVPLLRRSCYTVLVMVAWGMGMMVHPPVASAQTGAPAAQASPELKLQIEGPVSGPMIPVAADLMRRFYEDYPKLLERFDQAARPAPRRIIIKFDSSLAIPAHCMRDTITVGVKWLTAHPEDTALLTHELSHAVQQYPQPNPGWLTEGIADYARYVYGPAVQQNWSLPERFRPGQSYLEGYRTTARFLVWIEKRNPGTVDLVHRDLQNGKYDAARFTTVTGKSLDDLWKECLLELGPR